MQILPSSRLAPALDALTQYLAHHAKQVLAFEIDQRFVGILQGNLADCDNVKWFTKISCLQDFSWPGVCLAAGQSRLVVVANLPLLYNHAIIMR